MIDELKQQIDDIGRNIRELEDSQSTLMDSFSQDVEAIRETRAKSLEAYCEIMQKSAKLSHQGELYSIENDYSDKEAKIKERMIQFIRFKYDFLKNEFPEIAEYFEQNGAESEFYREILSESNNRNKEIKIEKTKVDDEDMEVLLNRNDSGIWNLNGDNLVCGDICLKSGSFVAMKIGDSNEYFGSLSISNNIIYFCYDNNQKLKITLQALNMGVIELKKK